MWILQEEGTAIAKPRDSNDWTMSQDLKVSYINIYITNLMLFRVLKSLAKTSIIPFNYARLSFFPPFSIVDQVRLSILCYV